MLSINFTANEFMKDFKRLSMLFEDDYEHFHFFIKLRLLNFDSIKHGDVFSIQHLINFYPL